jgi:hypothetical protein
MGLLKLRESACGEDQVSCFTERMGGRSRHVPAIDQMIDVHLPTTDGRQVILSRHTEPEKDHQLLLQRSKFELPAQPKPRITTDDKRKSA